MLLGFVGCSPPAAGPADSGDSPTDADGDGVPAGEDCNDGDPTIHPGAEERWYDGVDQACDGGSDWDRDGDGVDAVPTGYDCDDGDATVYPGAPEWCDGVDDDCDGEVDDHAEDAVVAWRDNDRDGWGAGQGRTTCTVAEGYATADGDCNDGDDAIHPTAAEVCNGVDDDCNGYADDHAEDATTVFPDVDRDGWGDDARPTDACSLPEGYVTSGGDCNDDDGAIHPDAAERCDGVDQDCDEIVDEECG